METRRPNIETDPLMEAQQTSDWLVDYLTGQGNEVAELPDLAVRRMANAFGPGEQIDQLDILRQAFYQTPDEDRANVALYFCGYPSDALEVLATDNLKVSLKHFYQQKESIRPSITEETRAVMEAERKRRSKADNARYTPDLSPSQVTAMFAQGNLGVLAPPPKSTVQPWADDALCAQTDQEIFFPEKGGTTKPSKEICAECVVAAECLEYALKHRIMYGIWGGKSPTERKVILRERGIEIDDDESAS